MKAILLDGKYTRQIHYVDSLDDIKITRWECGTFPSKANLSEVIYSHYVTINLGKPIAYYRVFQPIYYCASLAGLPGASMSQLALQQAAAMNYFNHNSFGL